MVYDFDNSEIKMGVSKAAQESGVIIYPPGERPIIKTKEQLGQLRTNKKRKGLAGRYSPSFFVMRSSWKKNGKKKTTVCV